MRHGTCFRRRLSARRAGAAPHSAVAELGVVRRFCAHSFNETLMSSRLFATSLISCLLCACAATQTTNHATPQLKWTKADAAGLTIELIDPVAAESLTITRYGTVMATVGLKNGPLAAPAYEWEIVSGRLRVIGYDEFTLLSRDASTVTVRRSNGKIAKFKIIRHERSA